MADKQDLSKLDVLALDYHGKQRALDTVCQAILDEGLAFAELSAEYTRCKARLDVLKSVKSSLQSSLRAESLY